MTYNKPIIPTSTRCARFVGILGRYMPPLVLLFLFCGFGVLFNDFPLVSFLFCGKF
jgi:hypothetical protein